MHLDDRGPPWAAVISFRRSQGG